MLAKKQVMPKAVGSSVQEESRSDWKEPEEVESVEDVVFKPVLPVNEAVFSGSHFTNLNSKHSVSHWQMMDR